MKKVVFVVLLLMLSSSVFSQKIVYKYKPPFIPASISYSDGRVFFSFEPSIVTPIGTFSAEVSRQIYPMDGNKSLRYNNQGYVRIKNTVVYKNDLLVIIRNDRESEDHYFKIKDGLEFSINTDGKTSITVKNGIMVIDLNKVERYNVVFNDNKNIQTLEYYEVKELNILSNPSNSNVYVDNLLAGITPCKIRIIQDHEITVENEPNYRRMTKSIKFTDNQLSYNFELKSILPLVRINSTPSNAVIHINGVNQGNTPKELFMHERDYSLKVKKKGYHTYREKINAYNDLNIHSRLRRKIVLAPGIVANSDGINGFELAIKTSRKVPKLLFSFGYFKSTSDEQKEYQDLSSNWRGYFNYSATNETILSETKSYYIKLGYDVISPFLSVTGGLGTYSMTYKNLKENETGQITLGENELNENELFTFQDDDYSDYVDSVNSKIGVTAGLMLNLDIFVFSIDYHFTDALSNNITFGALFNIGNFIKSY